MGQASAAKGLTADYIEKVREEGGEAKRRVRLRSGLRSGVLIAVGSVGAYLLVLYAFQVAPAGRVSTLREASVLVGLMLSGERPSPVVWTGAILVLAGALLAAHG